MKRFALCMAGVVAVSIGVLAQQRGGPPPPPPPLEAGASQADVDTALLAAPARLKDQAMVIKWKPDQTYTVLRKGGANNNLVCYDRSGFPLQQAFSIECTNVGNLDRVAQNMKIEALGDRTKAQAAFDEAEKNGTRVKPEFGSVFYHIQGPDRQRANPHMTIAVPGATMATLGLPESGRGGGVWIMNPGTTTAHLMVPGE
jgi:hypothetical protein